MDTESFIIDIKTEGFYEDIANDIEKLFHTSNYDDDGDRPLPKGMNKKKIVFFKNELEGKIMKEFVGVRTKTWSFVMNDGSKHKKPKGTKNV